MSRKSTLLALAAAASVGAIALSSSDAFAFHAGGSGVRVATAHVGGSGLRYSAYRAPALKIVKLPPPVVHPPHWHWHWAWHHRYWIPPVVVGGVGVTAATYAATAPATCNCNCLTKEYTPEGAVVFKDLCTHEMAMNPPDGPATADMSQPQQQGYLQPQTRAQ